MLVARPGPLLAALLAAALAVPVPATADEPDTTPPAVVLDPCPETPVGQPCSRREIAWVAQEQVDGAEGLAAAGVRIGSTVLTERVYDDGSGFTPYGLWFPPGSDNGTDHDYVTEVALGSGTHELTFFARDLAGNESSRTRTVLGPEVPDRPVGFRVLERLPRRWVTIQWDVDARGSFLLEQVVQVAGRDPVEVETDQPTWGVATEVLTLKMRPGRNTVSIVAYNGVGRGPGRSFVVRLPQAASAR